MYAYVHDIAYDTTNGARIKVKSANLKAFEEIYTAMGYDVREHDDLTTLTASVDVFSRRTPQFLHTYINKTFGTIPHLYLVAPMRSGNRYSQLCITYMIGFVLGMLARYFPTHWVSLAQGNKGDALWPTLNAAHRVVEETFPELVAEMIEDILAYPS
jgi:hypothetical protein